HGTMIAVSVEGLFHGVKALLQIKHQRAYPHSMKSSIDRTTQLKRRLIAFGDDRITVKRIKSNFFWGSLSLEGQVTLPIPV
ncbi:MAG: hypothetical protein ACE10C_05345, partial [Candidatus Binatia bacterium]